MILCLWLLFVFWALPALIYHMHITKEVHMKGEIENDLHITLEQGR